MSGCIYLLLTSSHSLERILGGFRHRTVSSRVWGIEHGLVLRLAFTAGRFYHIYGYYLSDGHVVMSVQQMCVKNKFCGFGELEVFHVLLAALCV